MSTTVTMRPRRFKTPAISLEDNGTRVSRSGMNTSWTREIGRPNNWPPITAVTYSATVPSTGAVLLVMLSSSCRPVEFGGLFLQRRDQAGTGEFGNIIIETGELSPPHPRRRHPPRARQYPPRPLRPRPP